jgi:hypothetical protein
MMLVRLRPPLGVSTACSVAVTRFSATPFPGVPPLRMCPNMLEASAAHSQGLHARRYAPVRSPCRACGSRAPLKEIRSAFARKATGGCPAPVPRGPGVRRSPARPPVRPFTDDDCWEGIGDLPREAGCVLWPWPWGFPPFPLHRLAATTAPSLLHPREFSPHPPFTDSRPPPLPPSSTPASFPRTHPSQTRGHHRSLPPPPPRVRRPLGAGEAGGWPYGHTQGASRGFYKLSSVRYLDHIQPHRPLPAYSAGA